MAASLASCAWRLDCPGMALNLMGRACQHCNAPTCDPFVLLSLHCTCPCSCKLCCFTTFRVPHFCRVTDFTAIVIFLDEDASGVHVGDCDSRSIAMLLLLRNIQQHQLIGLPEAVTAYGEGILCMQVSPYPAADWPARSSDCTV